MYVVPIKRHLLDFRRNKQKRTTMTTHAAKITSFYRKRLDSDKFSEPLTEDKVLFIGFTNRSGSTLLSHLFKNANLGGAELKDKNFEYFNFENVRPSSMKKGFFYFNEYYSWAIENSRGDLGYSTVKVNWDQLDFLAQLYEGLNERVKVFYIRRQNIIAQAVSLSVALQSKAWTSEHQVKGEVSFDAEQIHSCRNIIVRSEEKFEETFRKYGIKPFRISYEALVDDTELHMKKIFEGLTGNNFTNKDFDVPVQKQSSSKSEEFCERYILERPAEAKYLNRVLETSRLD